MTALIEARRVTKRYGAFTALDNVTLTLSEGSPSMKTSTPRPDRVFRATRQAMGPRAATKAAMDARTSTRCLPSTNQTVASCPPSTKRNASSSNNWLSDEVAS